MLRILLVEDEPDVRELYRLEIQDAGFNVRTATCRAEALAIAASWAPDCAVVDIKLGEESGLDLLGHLLTLRPELRTILLSAYPGYQEDFTSWLANAFVMKRSDTSELIRTLESLMSEAAAH